MVFQTLQPGPTPESPATEIPAREGFGGSVLVVDDEPGMRSFLQRGLARHFALVETAGDAAEADALLRRCHFDLLIADIRLPGRTGLDWVRALRDQGNGIDVIFISGHADLDTAIGALRVGASDFILKPFRVDELLAAAAGTRERRRLARENFLLQRETESWHSLDGFIGDCEPIKEVCRIINRVAPTRSTVLIHGESGTGKELAAQAIHDRSGRPGSFVAIDCGAVSPELMESELFGHVKGAFTGAHQAREGLFSYAHDGSLFLDEIGEMPLAMQSKLLRVLEEKSIRPVGGNQETPVDARIIAATNRDLAAEVAAGRFREDLYYRLNVVAVRLPPLRERPEDIASLTRFFLDRLTVELGILGPRLEDEDIERLRGYDWPGNVRELRNVLERSLLLGKRPADCIGGGPGPVPGPTDRDSSDLSLEAVERRHILSVLAAKGGNKTAAALTLGVSRKTLERKVKVWSEGAGPLSG